MSTQSATSGYARPAGWSDHGYRAFMLLRAAFTVAPILFGLDKFTNLMTDWPTYLAPWIVDLAPLSARQTMYVVGVVEVLAGIVVAVRPRFGGWLVAAWLFGIIVNLLTYPGFYDIALRDFGLLLAAIALALLAPAYAATRGRGRA